MTARRLARSVLATLLLLVLLPASRADAWSSFASLNTPIVVDPLDQLTHNTLEDGAGGLFVGWTNFTGSDYDVRLQRFDPTGAPMWGPNGVPITNAPGFQLGNYLVSDGEGGVIVVWMHFGTSYDIYAQRFNAAGVAQWTSEVPIVAELQNQVVDDVIADGAGGAIVSWNDGRNLNGDVYAQRVDGAGALLWTSNGVPVCTAVGEQFSSNMIATASGGALIVWNDERLGVGSGDVYAQHLDAAGVSQWAGDGVGVCTAPGDQTAPMIVTNGGTGAFIAWSDARLGDYHIYAQHLRSDGVGYWTPDGVQITAGVAEHSPVAVADGAGGFFVAWVDYASGTSPDLLAQRVNAAGTPMWGSGGVPIVVAPGAQFLTWWLPDGLGGIIFVWTDDRLAGNRDIYAQRLSAAGVPQWTANGQAVSSAVALQQVARGATDGANGLLVVFLDFRNGTPADIYGQRVERFGYLGNPEPDITGVRDVANDQGGRVRVSWTASYLDEGPGSPVTEYRIWRRVPEAAAHAKMAAGAKLKVSGDATTSGYWEYVATRPANDFPSYSLVTSTESDSVAGSNPTTAFLVEARQSSTGHHWDSQPDSGYSVDNLAPPSPAPFTGQYASGTSHLQWGNNPAPDLANYRLYRGVTSSFVPSPANRIASPTQNTYADPAGAIYWYKVSAVDAHGNESGYATALPTSTVDVPWNGLPAELRLGPPSPNPAHAGTTFRMALPSERHVRAAILDQQGRVVASLADRVFAAGEHDLRWDGRTQSGSMATSGLYFYRVAAGERILKGRIAVLR